MFWFNLVLLVNLNVFLVFSTPTPHEIYSLDEKLVCFVKRSCQECLKLSVCSWCSAENKCFSTPAADMNNAGYCRNNTIPFQDYGFSISRNAECACASGEVERNCHPPSVSEDSLVCSGRGQCVCGRCLCDPAPDHEHPSKTVVGEYCELDNFSCEGPHCDEGPYPLQSQLRNLVDPPTLLEEQPEE